MLKILINNDWFPVVDYQNYFIDIDEEGSQSMQFNIALNEIYHKIVHESIIQDEYNRWLVKSINQLTNSATIICELDMDDWRADYYLRSAEDVKLQTKTICDSLNYIKPSHWTIADKSGSKIKRTLDLEKCTAYDLLMRAKSVYDVQYDVDAINKTITIIDPYISIDNGVYVTPELNLTSSSYKGDSKSIVTRLYCYGADDMTFAEINDGKPYVENTSYKGRPICASWTDGRYTNMESLFEDGKKKLAEMAAPVGSYTLDVIDLQKLDEKYHNLDMVLRSKIHCIINPEKSIEVEHRVVKKRIYPDAPYQNRITLSNQPRTLAKEWDALKENIETVKKNGYRYETEIRQTNHEISETAKKTDENTKCIQSVEQKITPEQLMVLVSDSINNGNKLDTMKLIIDILGLTIKNGGIKIYDGKDELVFYLDEKTKKMAFNGDITGGSITGKTTINVGTDLHVGNHIYLSGVGERLIVFSENTYIGFSDYGFVINIGGVRFFLSESSVWIRKGDDVAFYFDLDKKTFTTLYNTEMTRNLKVSGDLTVQGKKNRVVKTKSYGSRKLNAVESASCYFTDEGQVEFDAKGKAIIEFDPIWLETVNTEKQYHIQLTPYCDVCPWIVEEHRDCCVIAGKPDTKVNWHVSALQKGYENTRLEMHMDGGECDDNQYNQANRYRITK